MITRFVADQVTKGGNSPVFGNPTQFGLDYEDVTFETSDGVTLSGWLVKGGAEKVVVQTHFGIQSSRSGYTPRGKGPLKLWGEDIVYLRHAKHLVNAGYSVLMYDLRNHGESGRGTCEWITGGVEEYRDVIAAVEFVSRHPRYADATIGLLSLCMGANSTTYAYGIDGALQDCPAIKALIAIQPVRFYDFMHEMGVPAFMVERANELNLRRGGRDFHASCIPQAGKITVPTLLVQNRNDPWTDMEWVERYFGELAVEKELFWIDGPKKRLAAYDYFSHHPEKMLEFLGKYL